MNKKSTLIKEMRVPITQHGNSITAQWVIGVYKKNGTYSISTSEHAFCHIDESIIQRIFDPIKHDLSQVFFNHHSQGSLSKDAELLIGSGVYTSLTGVKREGAALAIAYYLAEIVERVLAEVPDGYLDKSTKYFDDTMPPPIYEWIDAYNKRVGFIVSDAGESLVH